MRLAVVAVIASLAIVASAAAQRSGDPWSDAQTGLPYLLYKPAQTLGLKQNGFRLNDCAPGTPQWASATYGTYKGVLGTTTIGFAVYEGSPICADPAMQTLHGTRAIGGVRAKLGVYCDPAKRCPLSAGVTNGYTLSWTKPPRAPYPKRTLVFMESSRLTLAEFLRAAASLKAVR